MRLLSVNVGLPRDVSWRGRTVWTAIFKFPVAGRRRVGRLNVDGDGQADLVGHGGEHRAVYVYDRSAYEHWSEVLGRDDLVPGHFGENFTVEGLPDEEVCVGDRYRIGDATFEVTQPRVTCFKVGLRLEEPRMPALLYSHGRPGFYMRVLEEGEVGAGDEIERVAVMFGLDYFPDEGLINHSLRTVVIDRAGRVRANVEGNRFTAQQLGDLVNAALNR